MENLIVIAIIVLVLGASIAYIVKEKKKGVRCIGCPAAGSCQSHQNKKHSESGCGGGSNCGSGCHADAK